MSVIKEKHCSSCGNAFDCAVDSTETPCWCFEYPFVFDLKFSGDCFCQDCFKGNYITKIEQYVATITPDIAQDNKAKELPKTKELIDEIDYYLENGKYVFKPWFHLKRGYCCDNNCRHCPYKSKKK